METILQEKMSAWVSRYTDEIFRKAQLAVHLKACETCMTYEKHSKQIDLSVHNHLEKNPGSNILSHDGDKLKEKIISKLEDKYF